jgi:hypothetical protein
MSKTLIVSNFTDNTGYSNVARNLVLAMDAVGMDIYCQNIVVNPQQTENPPESKK